MAQRMGLVYDKAHISVLPVEAEIRRRLWWQIVLIDARVSELSGVEPAVSTLTKLPGNINDCDLSPNMTNVPIERPGLTEMVFFRLRCEIASFSQSIKGSQATRLLSMRDRAIDEFEMRIQREYLSYCDPSIPLHFMSIMMARTSIWKLRIGLRHSQSISDGSEFNSPQQEADQILMLA